MSESSPQQKSQSYTPTTLDDVRKLLDSKLISAGIPGALAGIAINEALQSQWYETAKFGGAATLVWLLIKIISRLTPKVELALDIVFEKLGVQVKRPRFKKQYLEALKTYCYALEVEGFRGNLPRLPLKEIFVPLRLDFDPDSTLTRKLIKKIWDLLPKDNNTKRQLLNSRLVIIADPGYGKTTLTRYLTLSYTDGSYRSEKAKELIPILLLFRTIHSQIQNDTTPNLPDLITQQILNLPRCQNLQPSAEWLEGWLKSGKCLVMLDGLDEVPQTQREKVSKWANWQMQAYPKTFILTSRPHGYDSSLFQGVQPVKIEDFDNDQKSDFIDKWYQNRIGEQWQDLYEGSQKKPESERLSLESAKAQSNAEAEEAAADLKKQLFANSALNELAKNPLLVTIIAATHEVLESLPKERTSLYKKILNLLLETRPNRRETRLTIPKAEDNQAVLQVLALRSLEQGKLQFTPEQARPWIEAKLLEKSRKPSLTPKKFLREIQDIAGLLAGGTEDGGLYQFTHKTFQEYLAALELKEQGPENILIEQFYNPDWQEVIVFYASLHSAKPFLELVLDNLETSPDKEYALELARRLAEETGNINEQRLRFIYKKLANSSYQDKINPIISLSYKLRNLKPINDKTAISKLITWGEYQLFLKDQASGQFHSSAEILQIDPDREQKPVIGISDKDARWFCAWLSTKANLQSKYIVYDYRLPSNEEMEQVITPSSSDYSENLLRVVRVEIPKRYQALLNYLANGRWLEADQETAKVMLEVAERKDQGYLIPEDIEQFPCEDLRIINQLWLKFSGNRFGFSVQKEIYKSLGGTKSYNRDVFEKFSDRVGWKGGRGFGYGDYMLNLNAPYGHLPGMEFRVDLSRTIILYPNLLSRATTCNL